MLEYEKKVLLTDREYYTLLESADPIDSFVQVNYYYDAENFSMNQKGITCRIRWKKGSYTTCIKYHQYQQDCCSSESAFGNSTTFDDAVFRNLGLDFQGALTTQRVIWLKTESLTVVLDHNLYLGHSDYELEVEYAIGCEAEADAFIKGLAKILYTFGVCDNPDEFCLRSLFQKSKSNRFFQRKQLFPLDQPIMNNREQGSHESF